MRVIHASVAALLFGLAASFLTGCSGGKARQEKYLERAAAFHVQGNYQQARVEVLNALQIDGNHSGARYLLARLDERERDWQQMFANLHRVINLDPNHMPARTRLGQLYYSNGRYDQAMEQVEALLALEADYPDALMLKGSIFFRQGKHEAAIREAHRALEHRPGHVGAISLLSEIYKVDDPERALAVIGDGLKMQTRDTTLKLLKIDLLETRGQIDQAIALYHELIQAYPENLLFHYRLVKLLEKHGRVDAAEAQLRGIIQRHPGDLDLKLWLVEFLSRQRTMPLAESTLQEFIQRQPTLTELQFALARLYSAQRKVVDARKVYQQLIVAHGRDDKGLLARNRLALLELSLNRRSVAEHLLAEVLALASDNSEALTTRARLALQDGHTKSAISDLHRVVNSRQEPVKALLLLANAQRQAGHPVRALNRYRQVLRLRPTNLEAILGASRLEIRQHNLDAAARLLEVAQGLDSGNLDIKRMLVAVYAKQARWREGHQVAETLIAQSATYALGHYLKGRLFLAENNIEAGIQSLTKVLEVVPLSVEALNAYTQALVLNGQWQQALDFLQEHAGKHPDHGHTLALLGQMNVDGGKKNATAPQQPPAQAMKEKGDEKEHLF
jgi:tetratricopeptide (TPR) repeat protein